MDDKVYLVDVRLASHEYAHSRRLPDGTWESTGDNMRAAAQEAFDANPDKDHMIVCVHEHGGWRLEFIRDGTIVGTANDAAVFSAEQKRVMDKLMRMERVWLPPIRRPEYNEAS